MDSISAFEAPAGVADSRSSTAELWSIRLVHSIWREVGNLLEMSQVIPRHIPRPEP